VELLFQQKGGSASFDAKVALSFEWSGSEENCELGYNEIFGTNAKIILVLQ
jgi:hypothetical protein